MSASCFIISFSQEMRSREYVLSCPQNHPSAARLHIFACHLDSIICCAASMLIAGRTVACETSSPGVQESRSP